MPARTGSLILLGAGDHQGKSGFLSIMGIEAFRISDYETPTAFVWTQGCSMLFPILNWHILVPLLYIGFDQGQFKQYVAKVHM